MPFIHADRYKRYWSLKVKFEGGSCVDCFGGLGDLTDAMAIDHVVHWKGNHVFRPIDLSSKKPVSDLPLGKVNGFHGNSESFEIGTKQHTTIGEMHIWSERQLDVDFQLSAAWHVFL